ncbi:DUF4298 domain-containing protein [Haoranjiania flava]|uniref:DUF4298 domain-containing protein n=1 Tax=Haoranjiania flava TaxID=1856322 RepID=A0AAE3IKJ5_9BACT|nr:DUF4298 domain-containing protein [Haoranjiania flava]MCU7693790.1 DUF4298 domain-containing protein [Haoranjiania flava]
MKKVEKIKQAFRDMDTRLYQAEKDLEEVIQFRKRLKEISKNMKVLQDFYHSDVWMKGRDILYGNIQENEHFYSVREDPIWNTTQDFYIQKIKLLQQLAKEL